MRASVPVAWAAHASNNGTAVAHFTPAGGRGRRLWLACIIPRIASPRRPGRPNPRMPSSPPYAAIDFGTSNSAVMVGDRQGHCALVELEAGFETMPTAVFYLADAPEDQGGLPRRYGRAAVAAYVEGQEGRLMRSMKSILGSTLVEQTTDVGGGRQVRYRDVVTGYLRHLRRLAEARAGVPVRRAVLGRPVHFVDDDAARDSRAQSVLQACAGQAGFEEVHFQYEPIAAALDHEQRIVHEQLLLVADIGGGTSDFSLLRVGPMRRQRLDRRADILANHGVHVAGTDFDRRIELGMILPLAGFGARGPARPGAEAREVPTSVYHDLATWHLINTVYAPARVAEWRAMKGWFAEPLQHTRLMRVLDERLGHALAATAEQAKIDVATTGRARAELSALEPGLQAHLASPRAAALLADDRARIVDAALATVRLAGVAPQAVEALYFTGGSTGLSSLVEAIGALFPRALSVRGERFASVARGLGVHAQRVFAAAG